MSAAPPKPWERARASGATGGGLASALPTVSNSVAGAGSKPWEQPQGAYNTTSTALARTTAPAARPWDSTSNGSSYARPTNQYGANGALGSGGVGYGASGGYGQGGFDTGGYGSSSGYGSGYGNSYGNNYRGSSYGGGQYGGYGGPSFGRPGYGGSYGGMGMSGGYGGYGSGANGSMYGGNGIGMGYGQQQGPPGGMMNTLEGALRPPKAWEVMLRGLHGIMNGFGRLSFLVDENTAAMHFFVSALLTLCDRAGTLYGEVARFLLRLLGWNRRKKMISEQQGVPPGGQYPRFQPQRQPGTVQLTADQQALASAWPSAGGTTGGAPVQSTHNNLAHDDYSKGFLNPQSAGGGVMTGPWRHG